MSRRTHRHKRAYTTIYGPQQATKWPWWIGVGEPPHFLSWTIKGYLAIFSSPLVKQLSISPSHHHKSACSYNPPVSLLCSLSRSKSMFLCLIFCSFFSLFMWLFILDFKVQKTASKYQIQPEHEYTGGSQNMLCCKLKLFLKPLNLILQL